MDGSDEYGIGGWDGLKRRMVGKDMSDGLNGWDTMDNRDGQYDGWNVTYRWDGYGWDK